MTVKLGTNITAQFLRQQFGRAAEDLSTATQRLASGQRIVRPSDDPAGLAIAERLSTDARVYTQGVRNLNAGISAISIAEGAMTEMTNILDRIDELAKQSQNGTLTQTQRNVMQQEVTALQSEWNRIVQTTEFNGIQLLTGNDTRLELQGSEGTNGILAVQFGEEQLSGGITGYAGGTTRISTSSSGVQGNGQSSDVGAMSADGRFVAFTSSATNLVAGDTNGQLDVFVKDTLTGAVTRVSTDSAGGQANGRSYAYAISTDGRFVAFTSFASNLVAGDTNGFQDAFVKDTLTGLTTRVSTDSAGGQADIFPSAFNSGSWVTSMSADGRFVVFSSWASDLVAGDTNSETDVFVKDMLTGATTRISTDSSGAQGNNVSGAGAISADGRYVAFSSTSSNLVAGDTNFSQDTFVKDTLTGVTTRVSTNSNEAQGNGISALRGMSADGRFVMFDSQATNLVAGDTNSSTDVFVKDTLSGITTRINTDSAGGQANSLSSGRSISADGRFVVFESFASNLVSGDTNNRWDTFVKDMLSGVTTRVSTGTAGTEGNNSSSGSSVISADGRFVAFESLASNLVSGDTNNTYDVFLKDLRQTGVNQLSGLIVSNPVSAGVTQILTTRARSELTAYRASLGTSLTRINSFANTLKGATINLQEAAARIEDADIAAEISRVAAARVRQEITAKLMQQVNLQPTLALMLLKG